MGTSIVLPKKIPPESQPITVYALETSDGGGGEKFAGYAIEEIEEIDRETGERGEPKSVAAVVVSGKTLSMNIIAAGIELSVKGLEADAKEREEAAKEAEESA